MGKSRNRLLQTMFVFVLLLVSFSSPEAKSKKPKDIPRGTPILWRAPTNIGTRNLFLGPGGNAMRPDLRRVKFIKEEKGGYSKKFRIEDGAGREWVAKVGKEAQSETAAVRLVWATGYETEVNYLVPRLTIPGQGTFENVRLEARPKNEKRIDEWKWKENPFVGSRELQGLKVLMLLLSNWDIKDSNNEIIAVKGTDQLRFIISDLGATFGKTGNLPLVWRFTRSRNNPEDYQKASFVEDVDEGFVDFHYGGKQRELFDDITVDQAHWIGNLLGRLSPGQIKDAFRAANYDREDQAILTKSVLHRIDQLRALSRQSQRDVTSKSDHSVRRE
jgi:hypothetical protein